ncbi:MAG: DedA family protein [Pirellulales bacterium]|nr:DedA family protein [Pirellulales bacterium]
MFATLLHPGSYLGIFALMVLTGCGLPLPEEVFIIGAGVLSANGDLRPEFAFPACLLGALIGDAAMYGIGYRFGHNLLRVHPFFARVVGAEREAYFERAVIRHGFKVLLLARFMVGVRGPVYLAAGVVRMPFARFLLWDVVCATLVVGAFFTLAYAFGDDIARLLKDAEIMLTMVVLAAIALVAFVALRRRRQQLLEKVIETVESMPANDEPPRPAPSETQREAS